MKLAAQALADAGLCRMADCPRAGYNCVALDTCSDATQVCGTPCGQGFWNDGNGCQNCTECIGGKTTESNTATNISDCREYISKIQHVLSTSNGLNKMFPKRYHGK